LVILKEIEKGEDFEPLINMIEETPKKEEQIEINIGGINFTPLNGNLEGKLTGFVSSSLFPL
jgi:hypothetical protein